MGTSRKEHLEKNLGLIIFMVVWAALFAYFWIMSLMDIQGGEIIYSIGAFYVMLPASALVAGVIYGTGNSRFQFVFPVLAGIMELLLGFLTFNLMNAAANKKWSSWNAPDWDWQIFFFTFVPALSGVLIGILCKKWKKTA